MIEIDKLSGDTARQILKSLIAQEKVDELCLQDTICSDPSAEMKRLTDTIHTLFCPHHGSSDDATCRYYEEDGQPSVWVYPTHRTWLENTFKLMEDLQISGEGDFATLYAKAKRVQGEINGLRTCEPNAYKILAKMNGWK